MTREPATAKIPDAAQSGAAPDVVPGRTVVWDGLGLTVPADWEPARLGLGYMMLENPAGPRLTLRWQRLKKPLGPEKVLKRLARQKILKPSGKPQGAVAAMLSALPAGYAAIACADATGRGADAVLFVLPGGELAVLAAPHARPDEKAAPWAGAVASLKATSSGAFSLFDVSGEAPAGFRLAAFSVQLGHFSFSVRLAGRKLGILPVRSLRGHSARQDSRRLGGNGFLPNPGQDPAVRARVFRGQPSGAICRQPSGRPVRLAAHPGRQDVHGGQIRQGHGLAAGRIQDPGRGGQAQGRAVSRKFRRGLPPVCCSSVVNGEPHPRSRRSKAGGAGSATWP